MFIKQKYLTCNHGEQKPFRLLSQLGDFVVSQNTVYTKPY